MEQAQQLAAERDAQRTLEREQEKDRRRIVVEQARCCSDTDWPCCATVRFLLRAASLSATW
jgi:hypothetical protein